MFFVIQEYGYAIHEVTLVRLTSDDVWGRLRFVFQGDHKYYKKQGLYDFPQKEVGTRAKVFIMTLMTKIPSVRKSIQKDMKVHMISGLQKVVKEK